MAKDKRSSAGRPAPRSKGGGAPASRAARVAHRSPVDMGKEIVPDAAVAGRAREGRPAGERGDPQVPGRMARIRGVAAPAGAAERGPARGDRGCYVYCIIRETRPLQFGPIGIDADRPDVYAITFRDLAAVVSDVPIAPLDSTRENVLAHERVNEIVMREHTVIPMSFGSIFKTHEDIVELLRSAYEAFSEVLNKMRDKLEFGLKVLWDRDEIVRVIEQEDEDISRLKTEIASQKGSTYFARMQHGRMVDAALQHRSERYVAEFLQRLRDVSVASRINRAIGDKMIMNAAFLVHRDREQAFDRRIKEIAAEFDKLTFKYTGPWPPYNFVNIRLKLERVGRY